jgi:hypothetical protein
MRDRRPDVGFVHGAKNCDAAVVTDVSAGEIKVMSGVVNGKRGDPKTKARKTSVPLIPSVRELLDLYRLRLGNPTTGVMFATEIGTPLDLKNVFTRRIGPDTERVCAVR